MFVYLGPHKNRNLGKGVMRGIGLAEIVLLRPELCMRTGITWNATKTSHGQEVLCSCESVIRYEVHGTNKVHSH